MLAPADFSALVRPLRLVLDTNVVMALWHFEDPALAPLRAAIEGGAATLFTRLECLDELLRVLAYVQFAIPPERAAALWRAYALRAQLLAEPDAGEREQLAALPRCRDGDDQKFLEAAWLAGADALVSRDKLVLALGRRTPVRGRLAVLTPERLQQQWPACRGEA